MNNEFAAVRSSCFKNLLNKLWELCLVHSTPLWQIRREEIDTEGSSMLFRQISEAPCARLKEITKIPMATPRIATPRR